MFVGLDQNAKRTSDFGVYMLSNKSYRVKYDQIQDVNLFDKKSKRCLKKKMVRGLKSFYSGIRRSVNMITIESPKIKWVMNYITKHPEDRILIYSTWIKFGIELLQNKLDYLKIDYVSITGKETGKQRTQAVKIIQ